MSTSIEWTDETWNPTTGCSKVSPGCKHCYAERLFPKVYPGRAFTDVRVHPDRLDAPLHWKKPRRVFVNSMSDLFHDSVPDEFIDRVFAVMALCPQHKFQVLTKRPARMREYFETSSAVWEGNGEKQLGVRRDDVMTAVFESFSDGRSDAELLSWQDTWPLPNVWLGVSVEDQKTADERIPLLLQTPAAVRFVSYEPALGPVNLTRLTLLEPDGNRPGAWWNSLTGLIVGPDDVEAHLDWVICGGESGPGARPCEIEWLESVAKQCKAAGVACFVKQLGAVPVMDEERWHSAPAMRLLSAKNAKRAPAGTVPIAMSDRKGKHIEEFPPLLQIREYPGVTP